MGEYNLIKDLALLWCVALIVGQICLMLRQPVIAGYMLAGIAIGPHGLKLVSNVDQITVIAEFGVAMLLFTLGVDIPLKKVLSSAGKIMTAGLSQMILTATLFGSIAFIYGLAHNLAESFLFGSACAISSSVIISRILSDRGEVDSLHGRILVPLALVQDLCLIFIIPALPIMHQIVSSSASSSQYLSLTLSALKSVLMLCMVIFGATKIMPHLLERSAKTNSREMFLLTVIVICLGIAVLCQWLGLSIAIGAFLAGMMMSESTYAHQALHDMTPLKTVFSIVFFVSVGMLLSPVFIANHIFEVFGFVILLVVGKAIIAALCARMATTNTRSALLVGVGLAQIGEFSFILLSLGFASKLVSESMFNLFLAAAVVSMIASPWLMDLIPKLLLRKLSKEMDEATDESTDSGSNKLQNHVIICGCGRVGKNLSMILETHQIPFVVIELNANIIEDLALRGIPHIYGDSMSPIVLKKANLKDASMLVLTMPDPLSAISVAEFARKINPDIKMVARANRTDDIRLFQEASVNGVVQPEFEASAEITRLVFLSMRRPATELHKALEQIRTRRYAIFQPDVGELDLSETFPQFGEDQMGIWFDIQKDDVTGKSIRDLNIREKTGATVTALKRGDQTQAFPEPTLVLEKNDKVYVVGTYEQVGRAEGMLGPEFQAESNFS